VPCDHPIAAIRSSHPNKSGKFPLILLTKGIDTWKGEMKIPCGQCTGCRLDQSKAWAIRCYHESKMWEENCFITLTYDDEHLTKNSSFDKRDLQKFFKRLRKKYEPKKIRYYACSEYGEQTFRPHYHAAIFNFNFADRKEWKNTDEGILYTSEEANKIWGLGNVIIGELTLESAAYIARYITKKIKGEKSREYYGNLEHPAQFMSRAVGIGRNWVESYGNELLQNGTVVYKGIEIKQPRYYDNVIQKLDEGKINAIKERRIKFIDENEQTIARLQVRETVRSLKMKKWIRDFQQRMA